jgi:CheY-like chemotaxis protein
VRSTIRSLRRGLELWGFERDGLVPRASAISTVASACARWRSKSRALMVAGPKEQCDIARLNVDPTGKRSRQGYPLATSSAHESPGAGSLGLKDLRILVVEDSWQIGMALKRLLRSLGADVVGPVATAAEAERLIFGRAPDAALVDFNLRGGERAHGLIDRLHDQGVRVVVISGYGDLPLPHEKVAAVLQKPIVEEQLLAALASVTKAAR